LAAEGRVDDQRQSFPGKVVHDGEDAELAAPGQRIGDKIEAPALVCANQTTPVTAIFTASKFL
jgi:hypothetical protein